jgi:hypothetical protein
MIEQTVVLLTYIFYLMCDGILQNPLVIPYVTGMLRNILSKNKSHRQ